MSIPGVTRVFIPEYIVVHLGDPGEEAENITISFIDYIKNVASSELYPTWPESALRANIYAIVSIALNRVYTEWYRTRGYDFDITNSTKYDQSFVPGRGVFDNISLIADEIFTDYVARLGRVEPLFTTFCDGRVSQCEGMTQWGTVDLANIGYDPLEILKYYYGDDIEIIIDNPVGNVAESYPGEPLELGDSGIDVILIQLALNRISMNFPAIPKIFPVDGNYSHSVVESVKVFQRVFNLPVTGIVDKGTWYRLRYLSVSTRKLAELSSKGAAAGELINIPAEELGEISLVLPSVQLIQYFLNILSSYYPTIPEVEISGKVTEETMKALTEFRKLMGLPQTTQVFVDNETWSKLYQSAISILNTIPPSAINLPSFIFPNIIYRPGSVGSGVYIIQLYLAYIAQSLKNITAPKPTGTFEEDTESAVKEFQGMFGLPQTGIVERETWDRLVSVYSSLKRAEQEEASK